MLCSTCTFLFWGQIACLRPSHQDIPVSFCCITDLRWMCLHDRKSIRSLRLDGIPAPKAHRRWRARNRNHTEMQLTLSIFLIRPVRHKVIMNHIIDTWNIYKTYKHLQIVVHSLCSLEKVLSVLLPNSNEQMNMGQGYFILQCYCHLIFSMFKFVKA